MTITSTSRLYLPNALTTINQGLHWVGQGALQALRNAHPAIDAQQLISSLDRLFDGRANYTLIGSTALHLHAKRFLKDPAPLPHANDLDLVINVHGMSHFNTVSCDTLRSMQIQKEAGGVLLMPRDKGDCLKVDLIADREFGFAKHMQCAQQYDGLKVAQITHTYDDDLLRLVSPKYLQMCGGLNNAKRLFEEKWKPFDQQQLRLHSLAVTPDIERILDQPALTDNSPVRVEQNCTRAV